MGVGASIDLLKDQSVIIDYTSLDREAISADLRRFAETNFNDRWTNFNETEFAVVFLEIVSYIADLITYQFNAVIGETQPSTCVRRQNFINIAKSYDFFLNGPVGSTVEMTATIDAAQLGGTIFADTTKFQAANGTVFMPTVDVTMSATTITFDAEAGDLIDDQLITVSDGSKNQAYDLEETGRQSPLLYENFPTGNQAILEITVAGVIWEEKRLEADAQSTDEVYFLRTDEDDISTVFFGDGINGKLPSLGAEIRYTAKVGTSKTSNVNPRTITTILTPIPGLISVTNVDSASGGRPRQTLEEGKAALPASISTNNRAVVEGDYAAIFLSDDAPAFVAKASASKARERNVDVWLVPTFGLLTDTQRNEASAFLLDRKILGQKTFIKDRVDIPIKMELDIFVASNYRADDVNRRVREIFVTEDLDVLADTGGNGVFDFPNVGLAARDDADQPQITTMRVDKLSSELQDAGVQKIVIKELSTTPVAKTSPFRVNNGNGTLDFVQYLKPRDVRRREYVVRFTSNIKFNVFRRIVGFSTFLTDSQLFDNRLNLAEEPDFALPFPVDMTLNPNRFQTLTFPVDTNPAVTFGGVVTVVEGNGSVFGNGDTGSEYYIEALDGDGVLSSATLGLGTYQTASGELLFQVSSGTVAFSEGDRVHFDIFPVVGDVLLRQDELPVFIHDPLTGDATDFITNLKTSI